MKNKLISDVLAIIFVALLSSVLILALLWLIVFMISGLLAIFSGLF